jgi:two-component system sensor histidine kinase PhoQ
VNQRAQNGLRKLRRLTSISLRARLLLWSSIITIVMVSIAAIVLERAYAHGLQAEFRQRQQLNIQFLLSAATESDNHLQMPRLIKEPRFNQLQSGLYAVLQDESGNELWRSASAHGLDIAALLSRDPVQRVGERDYSELEWAGLPVALYRFDIGWEMDDGSLHKFRWQLIEDLTPYYEQLQKYRTQLWGGLGVLAAVLTATLIVVMQWGLRPVRNLASEIVALQEGRQERLQQEYPLELKPLADNLNQLLEHEQAQRTRYRNTLADLAHSLKTPLAVLRGVDLSQPASSATVTDQVARMEQIVAHQLSRSVVVGRRSMAQPVELYSTVRRLADALQKVYFERSVEIRIDIADTVFFYGDESDLMEVMGNVMDNACKYGKGLVMVSAETRPSRRCRIRVEDDGDGIDGVDVKAVLQRGVRADTRQSGQGIGLAVVAEIVDLYDGSIAISRSSLGGALVELVV